MRLFECPVNKVKARCGHREAVHPGYTEKLMECKVEDLCTDTKMVFDTDHPNWKKLRKRIEKTEIQETPSRGIGDTMGKVLSRAGLRPCGSCQSRRRWLNRIVPYKRS
jgi:hypothetical protein